MKAFILTEADFEKLLLRLDRNPKHGANGGSSVALNDLERKAHEDAHRFFHHQVCRWLDEVKQ